MFVAGGKGAALRVEVVLPQIWVKCYIDVNDRTRVDVYFYINGGYLMVRTSVFGPCIMLRSDSESLF